MDQAHQQYGWHLRTKLSTEIVRNYFLGINSAEVASKRHCHIFAHGSKVIINQGLEMPCMALRTILSTKNVQNLYVLPVLSSATRLFGPACFLRNVRIVLQNKDMKTGRQACAQSYPQNMGRTGYIVYTPVAIFYSCAVEIDCTIFKQ